MPKAAHANTRSTPTAPRENPLPDRQAETSPLDGGQIQQLLDAVRRTSGLLAVQHTLFGHLDGSARLEEPLLRHGLYEFNRFVAETFGEVESKAHALVQEIAKAVREGADAGATTAETARAVRECDDTLAPAGGTS